MTAHFIVSGIPKAKGRPRFSVIPVKPEAKGGQKFSRAGNYVKTYTPKDTIVYENLVRLEYERQCEEIYFDDLPIRATIKAYFPIPKSVSKRKREEMSVGIIKHDKKPDCDNLAKSILDALNGIAFCDDSQICKLTVHKLYSSEPRVDVLIETL